VRSQALYSPIQFVPAVVYSAIATFQEGESSCSVPVVVLRVNTEEQNKLFLHPGSTFPIRYRNFKINFFIVYRTNIDTLLVADNAAMDCKQGSVIRVQISLALQQKCIVISLICLYYGINCIGFKSDFVTG